MDGFPPPSVKPFAHGREGGCNSSHVSRMAPSFGCPTMGGLLHGGGGTCFTCGVRVYLCGFWADQTVRTPSTQVSRYDHRSPPLPLHSPQTISNEFLLLLLGPPPCQSLSRPTASHPMPSPDGPSTSRHHHAPPPPTHGSPPKAGSCHVSYPRETPWCTWGESQGGNGGIACRRGWGRSGLWPVTL